ncbi:MAG: hypothetical protein IT381_21180 [Deltaproteobacteria bacterium]|nr:hypothetical protein [Deltaproteobacteria bacterium]
MTTAPTKDDAPPSSKRAIWMPDELYERLKNYVDKNRNAPRFLSINKFVREAIETALSKQGKR